MRIKSWRTLSARKFYQELTSRNRHFVSKKEQGSLSRLRVFIAGCGAAGGACVEPLVRLGVTHLKLTDNGAYELTNLNRQHAFIDSIGMNKSTFHKREALRINPHIDVQDFPTGITPTNLEKLVNWADIIIDAVDVTVQKSIQMKFSLHEMAHAKKKPVLSPLDPGFCQLGQVFDYRKKGTLPLYGKLRKCRNTSNPIEGLLAMFPLSLMPDHSLPLIADLLEKPGIPASQLGISADLLSSIVASIILGYASHRTLPKGWWIDVAHFAQSKNKRAIDKKRGPALRKKIKKLVG